jgi:1,4-alpha-glucan branching enzyme
MPGDPWQKAANLRAYLGFMWGHPGKKLLFMGQEWGQRGEWNEAAGLPWHQADEAAHAGIRRLVADLNQLYRSDSALHELDCESAGFEWLVSHDEAHSVYAWLRKDRAGRRVLVVCNFTPVPRHGYRLNVAGRWRERLNTDSEHYGGSNVGNGSQAREPAREGLDLPPLGTLYLSE